MDARMRKVFEQLVPKWVSELKEPSEREIAWRAFSMLDPKAVSAPRTGASRCASPPKP